ncbi:MAG: hypothetical protein J5605_04725, partial [Bacteroidales bacterium]|nr:hypothetical protein [Bacteroidales bacterium]
MVRAVRVDCSCISLQGKFSDNLHSTCGVQCHASVFVVLFVLWALEGNLKVAPDTYQGREMKKERKFGWVQMYPIPLKKGLQ